MTDVLVNDRRSLALIASVFLLSACETTMTPLSPMCSPATCTSLGAECGPVGDGCGGVLDCGSCASGEACGVSAANQCGALCTPTTCAMLGAECGTQADGCGGTIACGECAGGETCGGGGANRCGTGTCTPTTCDALGADCGPVGDGCGGVLACGTCASGEACGVETPSVCGEIPCTPTTCAAMGAECGTIPDGCGGELTCPVCPSGEVCGVGGANRCGAMGIDAGPPGDSGIPATCTGVTCSGHGRCVVGAAGAECLCDEGFFPMGADCVDPCDGVDCLGGRCYTLDRAPLCGCRPGIFADGPACAATAPGEAVGIRSFYRVIPSRIVGTILLVPDGTPTESIRLIRWSVTSSSVVWDREIAGTAQYTGVTLVELPDGDILVGGGAQVRTGDCAHDAWLIRLGPDGTPRAGWPRTYTTGNLRAIHELRVRTDGSVVAIADTCSLSATPRVRDTWLHLGADGAVREGPVLLPIERTYRDIVALTDGGSVLVGGTRDIYTAGATSDIDLLAIDASGSIRWERSEDLGGFESASSLVALADGTLVVGGLSSTGGASGPYAFLVAAFSPSGALLWHRRLADGTPQGPHLVAHDGGVVMFGSLSNAYGVAAGLPFVMSLDHAGDVRWVGRYGVAEAAPGAETTYAGGFAEGAVLGDGTLVGVGSRSERRGIFGSGTGYIQHISATGAPL